MEIFKRAQKYVAEYRRAEKDLIRMRRLAKSTNKIYVSPEPKLAFVIRIRGCAAAVTPGQQPVAGRA